MNVDRQNLSALSAAVAQLGRGRKMIRATSTIRFRSRRVVATFVFGVLLILFAAVILSGFSDTTDWVQFAVPIPFFVFFACQGLRRKRLSIRPLFLIEGTVARMAGILAALLSGLSGYFGFFTFLRWLYS